MFITILNQHSANFGDDAAGVALVCQVREFFPEAEIHIVYNWQRRFSETLPITDDKIFHHEDLILNRKDVFYAIGYLIARQASLKLSLVNSNVKELVNVVRKSDIVLVSPCGANIGIYKDWYFLFRILVSVLERKKTVFHLNTLGKSNNVLFNLIAKFVMRKTINYVREFKSAYTLNEWGICNHIGVDTAFSLPKKNLMLPNVNRYIAFIPTQLSTWHPHFKEGFNEKKFLEIVLSSLVKFCNENNVDIKILPHLHGDIGEGVFLKKVTKCLIALADNHLDVKYCENIRHYEQYEEEIVNSFMVVSMRYHGVIFAIKNAIPFVSLNYENKMREACIYSGANDLSVEVKGIDNNSVYNALCQNLQKYNSIQNNLIGSHDTLTLLSRIPMNRLYLESKFDLYKYNRGCSRI